MDDVEEERAVFYMVWTKTGRCPRIAHNDFDAAAREAKRLAAQHPGKKFIVLKAVAKYGVRPVLRPPTGGEPHTGDLRP